jgi:GTP-binding protein
MKALARGLRPIVVINKVDRSDARAHEVHDEVFDLFAALDANDDQLDFPTLFASGRSGWAAESMEAPRENLNPLFDLILRHVPPPVADKTGAFKMLATTLEYDPYVGRILTGRIHTGIAKVNMAVKAMARDGKLIEDGRLTKLFAFRGLDRVPVESAEAGDIIAIAGLTGPTVADTICEPSVSEPIAAQPIDPPTLVMTFSVNDSPLAGREGTKVTSRMIRDRLMNEAEGNVAIRVRETETGEAYEVAGRGELQLGVLIETMRREGFELSVGRPRVLLKTGENGEKLEPIEEVQVDVDEQHSGIVVETLGKRRGEMTDMRPSGGGKVRLTFLVPSRGLIGYHGQFLSDTRGTGIMNKIFHSYQPWKGPIDGRHTGVLISNADGVAVAYALWNLEDRGPMMITSGVPVYEGMIIGEHTRDNDLEVNPLKAKKLTNVRASGKDENVVLQTPKILSLEQAIAYIADDELVEVTPKSIRLRKKLLDPNLRKRAEKTAEAG